MSSLDYVNQNAVDSAMISLSTKSMGGGTISLVLGYLTSSGFAVLLGIVLTVLGFIFNYYFQRKQNHRNKEKWDMERRQLEDEENRRRELHQLKMAKLREEMQQHDKVC